MKHSFLRDDKPANAWTDCYLQGNGSLGVADMCNPTDNTIYFNLDTFWSGTGSDKHTKTLAPLAEIRELLDKKKTVQAEKLIQETVCGYNTEKYLPLATLKISSNQNVENYERKLDLHTAILTYANTESFVSYVDQVYVLKTPVARLELTSQVPHEVSEENGRMSITCKADKAVATLYVDIISEASAVGATPCRPYTQLNISCNPQALDKAKAMSYEELKSRHIKDYQSLFLRSDLEINGIESSPQLTEKALRDGTDTEALTCTLFDLGKYLTISASRAGTEATNLQGIWNDKLNPPWSSNYTININTEMNYFGTDAVNLSECVEPLFSLVKKMFARSKSVCPAKFGFEGFFAGHNTDFWGQVSTVGKDRERLAVSWGMFTGGASWLLLHLFDHYNFTQDKAFLAELFPYLEASAQFYDNYLYLDQDGYYKPSPSTSPENRFKPNLFFVASVAKASTIECTLARSAFKNYLEALKILDVGATPKICNLDGNKSVGATLCRPLAQSVAEKLPKICNLDGNKSVGATPCRPLAQSVAEKLPKIYPYRIMKDGRLAEWDKDYHEVEPQHRHVSHLLGLHPYNEITPIGTPELAKSARKTLDKRGLGGTGWSLAWKVNFYARLGDGDTAYKLIKNQLRLVSADGHEGYGGSYGSLLCAHPPFQIDGNFGVMAGICEMLIQSHTGKALPLPALPKAWHSGKLTGIRIRGGKTINLEWKDGKVLTYEEKPVAPAYISHPTVGEAPCLPSV